jgi:hypothetical protein
LIDFHLNRIEDAKEFNDPPYVVTADKKKIGYRVPGSMEVGLFTVDYRTAFAYLHEVSSYPTLQEAIPTVLALQIPCGRFSYAQIPSDDKINDSKPFFEGIMGVTGTLGCLHEEEKKVAKEEYKVSLKVQGHHRTIVPSMYEASKVEFKEDRDVPCPLF